MLVLTAEGDVRECFGFRGNKKPLTLNPKQGSVLVLSAEGDVWELLKARKQWKVLP